MTALPDEALALFGCPICGARHLVWTFRLAVDAMPERLVLCSRKPKQDTMWLLTPNG